MLSSSTSMAPSTHDFPLKERVDSNTENKREFYFPLFKTIPRLQVFHTPKTMHTKCPSLHQSFHATLPPLRHPIVRLPRNSLRRKGNFLESYVDAAILTHFRSLIDVCVLRRCRKRRLFPLWAPAWAGKTTFGKHRLLSCNHKLG